MKRNLNDLIAFVTVAREGSFTRAAAQLGGDTTRTQPDHHRA